MVLILYAQIHKLEIIPPMFLVSVQVHQKLDLSVTCVQVLDSSPTTLGWSLISDVV